MKKIESDSKIILCTLKDKVADSFGAPTTFVNENVAVRSFTDLLDTPQYLKHKGDYELYQIGFFDSKTANISVFSKPKFIVGGASFDSK